MESLNIGSFNNHYGFFSFAVRCVTSAGTDKTHHFIVYAMLMLPTALRKPANWIIWGLFFIVYRGAIELIQPFINRYGEWMDLFANAAGVICGVMIAWLINFIINQIYST